MTGKKQSLYHCIKVKAGGVSVVAIGDKLIERSRKSVWENFDRLMEVTEGKVIEDQGGFRKGRGCVDQIFAMRRLVEWYLGKDKKLYAAFMDLRRHTIGLTEKLSGVCCKSMMWVDSC